MSPTSFSHVKWFLVLSHAFSEIKRRISLFNEKWARNMFQVANSNENVFFVGFFRNLFKFSNDFPITHRERDTQPSMVYRYKNVLFRYSYENYIVLNKFGSNSSQTVDFFSLLTRGMSDWIYSIQITLSCKNCQNHFEWNCSCCKTESTVS